MNLSSARTFCVAVLLCACVSLAARGQTFNTIFNFTVDDGIPGQWVLAQGTDGALYGTAPYGGANRGGTGTIYKLSGSGFTLLYTFCAQTGCPDGSQPEGGLALGPDGNFYGTTFWGGAYNWGSVFKITPQGVLTTLHSFCPGGSRSLCPGGSQPEGTLVLGPDGNFYGTTYAGGHRGDGTIFRITPEGSLRTLYSFCFQDFCADGIEPDSGLILGTDGNFYGTTFGGGNPGADVGTVFKITPGGTLTTLYSFCPTGYPDCTDGEDPVAPLALGTDGNFYGSTITGGKYLLGNIFKITPAGGFTSLYSFCAHIPCSDGSYPAVGLELGSDGNLYGANDFNGLEGGPGTIFEITPGGVLTTLYTFRGIGGASAGGSQLLQATSGIFFGTAANDSLIFDLTTGLSAHVQTVPTTSREGAQVLILGSDLIGATSVTFNGTPAVFTVDSGTLIRATVPAGASTGKVQVVTPGGTLSTNAAFGVLP